MYYRCGTGVVDVWCSMVEVSWGVVNVWYGCGRCRRGVAGCGTDVVEVWVW